MSPSETRPTFQQHLQHGLLGESLLARWWRAKGYHVLPAYEIEQGAEKKGPRLFMAEGDKLITPDLLVFNTWNVCWIEAKTKSAFTYYRKTGTFQTGIDGHVYADYRAVQDRTPWPVVLMFVHEDGKLAKDTPEGMTSPSGVFGERLDVLAECIDHTSPNWGRSGMVYWDVASLRKFCEYQELLSVTLTAPQTTSTCGTTQTLPPATLTSSTGGF